MSVLRSLALALASLLAVATLAHAGIITGTNDLTQPTAGESNSGGEGLHELAPPPYMPVFIEGPFTLEPIVYFPISIDFGEFPVITLPSDSGSYYESSGSIVYYGDITVPYFPYEAPTPIPGAAILLGSGLFAAMGLRRGVLGRLGSR